MKNYGNSKIIQENSPLIIKLAMLQYECIFDFQSEEVRSITVQKSLCSEKRVFEEIMRIRKWSSKETSYSWQIYSMDRELLSDILIRKVEWDIGADQMKIKKMRRTQETDTLLTPTMRMVNMYINHEDIKELALFTKDFDTVIQKGIVFEKNSMPDWKWRDLEIKRLYNWGQINLVWECTQRNDLLEEKVSQLVYLLDELIEQNSNESVELISLNYSILPNFFLEGIM